MAQQMAEPGQAVADVYAGALFALARDANAIDEVQAELAALTDLMASDAEIDGFFRAESLDPEARRASLEKLFRGKLRDEVLNTLQVLNDHSRLMLLPLLRRAFELRVEDARGQIEVQVQTAVTLDAQQRQQVEEVAAALSGRKPLVTYAVEPELVGGLILQIGDQRYDNSLRRHLAVAQAQLRERGTRGLGIGEVNLDGLLS